MTYQEQLLDTRWLEKRKTIIKRDAWKCQNCANESYKNRFAVGLIFSNNLPHGTSNSVFHKESFIINIWDFKVGKIQTAFIKNPAFSPNESYIAVYKEGYKYAQLLALKNIDNSKIELSKNILDIVKNGIKGKVSQDTYQTIYRTENKLDTWKMVLGLHVHHRYYQNNLLAWQYPDNALITLCWDCHEDLHSNTIVPILDSIGNKVGTMAPCRRCFGAGVFPEFVHVDSGICFRCKGAKYEELIK